MVPGTFFKGFSTTNLKYMRFFAEQCPNVKIGQQPADQLPWFHIVTILTKTQPDFITLASMLYRY